MIIPQEKFEAVRTATIGAAGTTSSVFLQNFNQLMAGLAATATLIYVCLKIFDWWINRRDSK